MPKLTIDGREVEFTPGENLVDAAARVGIEIPVFCYHPGLSVAAQCRICMVEIEKMPKVQTACSTKCAEGMVVKTKTPAVKQARESVMEFLLVNHPLDCPICDKAGECDLQDNSFKYGSAYMRTSEERRTYLDLDMGPVIKKNMNRCIHCTRCIRFGAEVAGIREMVALQRGNNTEISTIDGRPLETDYAGNYADICPTGSLTLKDFRFEKRVWFLKKTPSICEGCSRGCNIELHWDHGRVYRTLPRTNLEVNKHWICDEGRFNFHYLNDEDRISWPKVKTGNSLQKAEWSEAIQAAKAVIQGKKVLVAAGSDLTNEEVELLKQFASIQLGGAPLVHFGTPGVKSAVEDGAVDKILKRKSKTSNLHGLESLGLKSFETAPSGIEVVLVIRGGRAQIPALKAGKVIGVGVFSNIEAAQFDVVLPGAAFAEKNGTIVNFEGRKQSLQRAVVPPGKAKALSEIIMMWTNGSKSVSPEAVI